MRRGFFQDLAFLAQDPVLAAQPAQPAQFLLLVGGQSVMALPLVEIGLLEPQPQCLAGHAQFASNLRMGLPAGAG
jgi:hypothetical protein